MKKKIPKRFIIQLWAHYTGPVVIKGKKYDNGDEAGAIIARGKISNTDFKGYVDSVQEAVEVANQMWVENFPRKFKQITIKEDGKVVAYTANFRHKRVGWKKTILVNHKPKWEYVKKP